MEWTNRDKHLFTIVNQSGNYHLERQIANASEIYFTLKQQPSYYCIFGYYNLNTNTFHWENKMNEQSYKLVKREHMDVFGSEYTIKKLFKAVVQFNSEYMNIIPYLMEALNEDFNVIRVKSSIGYIYALTKVEGTHRTFNYSIFEEALWNYRSEVEGLQIKKRNQTVKKKIRD